MQVGTQIGRYKLQNRIGGGLTSVVYRATETDSGREVALKLLARALAFSAYARADLKRDIERLAALNHPQIVPTLQTGMYREQVYLIQPYFTAGSLAERMGGEWTFSDARQLIEQLSAPLTAAHNADIVHGGLKPSNILFDSADTPHVSDFGLTQLTHANSGGWRGNALAQTPYTAPEQQGGRPLDPRVDIYALGMLFAKLTGDDAAVERVTSVDPNQRPHTVRDLLTNLQPTKRNLFSTIFKRVSTP